MVVLSAAICSRNGKALMARQFVEMSRIRIEGLLAAFPKLLGSDSKQHTFVETESVRYVYQPLETLYLVLITNKASNIVEDVETIRLLSKVVPDVAGGITEERISGKCFELVFAFDEVITTGGYREPITLQQIRTNMEMESHEEKLYNMIRASQMESARDEAQRQARAIRERQREQMRSGMGSGSGSGMAGMGSGSGSGMGGFGSSSSFPSPSSYSASPVAESPASQRQSTMRPAAKGMQLGGAKKKSNLLDALVKEDNLAPVMSTRAPAAASGADEMVQAAPVVNHPVMISIEEKVRVNLTRDGVLQGMEIKGTMSLTATNDEAGRCQVSTAVDNSLGFNFQTHPKINKALYDSSGKLVLKEPQKGFPAQRPVGILRWTHQPSNDSLVPIKINCWPEEESRGRMLVTIEYSLEHQMELHNVNIVVPLGTADAPSIINVDGQYKHDASRGILIWQQDIVDSSNSSGSLEFQIACSDPNAFFPIEVHFTSHQLYSGMRVATVTSIDGAPIQFGVSSSLNTEDYVVN